MSSHQPISTQHQLMESARPTQLVTPSSMCPGYTGERLMLCQRLMLNQRLILTMHIMVMDMDWDMDTVMDMVWSTLDMDMAMDMDMDTDMFMANRRLSLG